ncbi:MAG: galactokinase, partial [Saprospiraceae bacterium]
MKHEQLLEEFLELYQENPKFIAFSPGRVNIIGEHTDYNDGFVLPAAIDKGTTVLIRENGLDKCRAYAFDLEEYFEFDLSAPDELATAWQKYVVGVTFETKQFKNFNTGFDLLISGNVPQGAGMSSSASIECAITGGINALFSLDLSKEEIARISQKAEHNYAGVKCGIMDQFASAMGKENHCIFLDCRSLEYEYIPLELGDYCLLLCNTNVSHSLADSEYNTRREQCEKGISILKEFYPEINKLRDVELSDLIVNKNNMEDIIFQRCLYVVSENARVKDAISALGQNDLITLGELMYQSHNSLQNDYEV